jgi:hypothetical protein
VHTLSSVAHFTFFILEVFMYGHFQQSVPTYVQIVFSGICCILTLISWSSITSDKTEEKEKEYEPRPRRLVARHYMESQIKDFETDPKKLK